MSKKPQEKQIQRKLNIAVFSNQTHPIVSGAADVVTAHCEELIKLGHNVVLFCEPLPMDVKEVPTPYTKIRFDVYMGVDIDIKFPKQTILDTIDQNILAIFNSVKFDIVYTHAFGAQSYVGKVLAQKHSIPHIAHVHTNFLWGVAEGSDQIVMLKTLRDFYSSASAVVYTNEQSKQVFSKLYQIEDVPAECVGNASMLPTETPVDDNKVDLYKRAWLCEEDVIFAYSGRVEYAQKNLEFTLQVLKKLVETGLKVKLWIIGTGDLLTLLQNIVQKGLQAYIIICGVFTDKQELKNIIAATDVLMFPSYYDTDGISIKDFARMSKPSILIDETLCAYDKKESGALIIPNNVDSAVDIIYNSIVEGELPRLGELCKQSLDITWQDIVKNQLLPILYKYAG